MKRQAWAVLAAAGAYGASTAGQLPPLALIPPPPAARFVAPPPRPVPPPSEAARPSALAPPGRSAASSPGGAIGILRVGNQPPQMVRVIRVARALDEDSLADVFNPATGRRFTTPVRDLTFAGTQPQSPPRDGATAQAPKRTETAVVAPNPALLLPPSVAVVARQGPSAIKVPMTVGRPNYVTDAEQGVHAPQALAVPSPGVALAPAVPSATPDSPPKAEGQPPAGLPSPANRTLTPLGLAAQTMPTGPEFPKPSQVRRLIQVMPQTPARTPDRIAKAAVPTTERAVQAAAPAPTPVSPVRVSVPQSVSVVPVAARIPDPVPIQFARLAPPPPGQMEDELRPYVRDLTEALRPSVREQAATALADGRYGWRPEVKGYLVTAAQTDPSPAVQARCIRLLSRLGYHDTTYLQFLLACCESQSRQVTSAAGDALNRLGIRY